jgi:tetratricopeptide (TPR) repeat protein
MIGGSRTGAALLASCLLAGPVHADPKGPTDKDKQVAGELVKKAIARSQAGDHSAAIEIYLQAYTIVPNSLLLSNIGAEFQQSGRPQEALRYFCMYLEKDPTGTNVPYATAQARSLQIQIGNKNVDDNDVCAPPKQARPDRKKPPKDPPPEPVDARPEPPVAKGGLVDEPSSSGGGGGTLKYVGLAAGAAGLAAVGIGIYDGIQAKKISDEISRQPTNMPWPDGIRQLQSNGQAYENYQIGFLIAGGVLVTTGAILFMVGRSDEASRRSSDKATVTVTPTTNGFAVFGTF